MVFVLPPAAFDLVNHVHVKLLRPCSLQLSF